MATSCVSLSVSALGPLAIGKSIETVAARQVSRIALAAPSLSGTWSVEKTFAGLSVFSLGTRSVRNAGIAARAADLEEAETVALEAEAEPEAAVQTEPESAPAAAAAVATKLYVGNLPWSVHSQQLAEIFQEFGNVELVEVIYDRETQKSRGFAFVTMSTADDANRAIEGLDGSELDGRVIKVNVPQTTRDTPRTDRFRSSERPRATGGSSNSAMKIFVGNLSWGVDDVALDELFSEYGKVVEATVVYDKPSGRSRGFGFVTMTKEEEVSAAIQSLDGADFEGRTLRVNHAGDKPERRDSPRY